MNLVSFLNLRPGASTCAAPICSNTSCTYTDSKPVNCNSILNSIPTRLIKLCYFIIHHINNLAI